VNSQANNCKTKWLFPIIAGLIPFGISFWAAIEVPYGYDPGSFVIILVGSLFSFGLGYGVYTAKKENSFKDGYLDVVTILGIATISFLMMVAKFLGLMILFGWISSLFKRR